MFKFLSISGTFSNSWNETHRFSAAWSTRKLLPEPEHVSFDGFTKSYEKFPESSPKIKSIKVIYPPQQVRFTVKSKQQNDLEGSSEDDSCGTLETGSLKNSVSASNVKVVPYGNFEAHETAAQARSKLPSFIENTSIYAPALTTLVSKSEATTELDIIAPTPEIIENTFKECENERQRSSSPFEAAIEMNCDVFSLDTVAQKDKECKSGREHCNLQKKLTSYSRRQEPHYRKQEGKHQVNFSFLFNKCEFLSLKTI